MPLQTSRASIALGALAICFLWFALILLFNSPAIAAMNADALPNGSAQLTITPANSTGFVGSSTTITIDVTAATNLYGYQFQVNYDPAKVTASGTFLNGFLDSTLDVFIPGNWNAACSAGACKFALTKTNPGVPANGAGSLAKITFTGLAPGQIPLTFSGDILADRNGFDVGHTATGGTLTIYGNAIITGTVNLQGRATPITSGTVTLSDNAAKFAPTIANFDASTGIFSATVPVDLVGSTYNLTATHSLYLSNQLSGLAVVAGGTYNAGTTMLRAGDANNDGTINVFDLSCVGGGYGTVGTICGTGGSDINADGTVNIFDLVLVGGNYELSAPRPW